jgi:ATP-dependent DNA helicase RecQ
MINHANKILKETFGYNEFKSLQEEIIKSVLDKKDTLVLMPTGGGKSICYQIPAMLFEGLTIVVSPLISLMKDQIDQLKLLNIPAVMLNSSLDLEEYHENKNLVRNNKVKLLYVAPETLVKPDISEMLFSLKVDCIAIDEAHCISEWGHDFRPEYRQIVKFRKNIPSAVCMALTATATERVRQDILKNLDMKIFNSFIASFNRENLFFQVMPKQNSLQQTLGFLNKFPAQSGIIYCFSRNQVDSLAEKLMEYGYFVKPYHAGLTDEERKHNQELFIKDEVQIIVATIAFGMGIHKTNVRFVIHHDLPKSIESYYQETGRAGRDSLPAHCLLLYSYSDIRKIKYFIDQKDDENEKSIANQHLSRLVDYAETNSCRRIPLIRYFGEDYSIENCGACDNCTGGAAQREDVTVQAQMFLSCVKRTDERFGMNHVIDILRGSESKKIIDFGHNKLPTYGISREYSKKIWQHLARQFIREGALIQDSDDFGILKITQRGYNVMKGLEKIQAVIMEDIEITNKTPDGMKQDYDTELFNILRIKRKVLADMENIPPYIIFSDKTLIEMSAYFPQHKSAMMDIYGIGLNKFDRYGKIFIDLIRDYCSPKNIEEKYKASSGVLNRKANHVPKYIIVGKEYYSGISINEIVNRHQVKLQTIINHLYDFILDGGQIKADGLKEFLHQDKDIEAKILKTYADLGTEKLKPVYDSLGGNIDYEILSVYRVYYLCKR